MVTSQTSSADEIQVSYNLYSYSDFLILLIANF